MFSKKLIVVIGVFLFFAVTIIVLTVPEGRPAGTGKASQAAIYIFSPFQKLITCSIRFVKTNWEDYFFLISTAKQNRELRKALQKAQSERFRCKETELANVRLRNLLDFKFKKANKVVAAEVIGEDPSHWFRSIVIDKGLADNIKKGFPVVVSEGIVGQIADVSYYYSKVLLVTDRNSSVDAMVHRSRARGIVKGQGLSKGKIAGKCLFEYVLRKDDVKVGDTIIASGLDSVYPKGLQIGYISKIVEKNIGIFQEIVITPSVDFEKLEEVLVVMDNVENELEKGL